MLGSIVLLLEINSGVIKKAPGTINMYSINGKLTNDTALINNVLRKRTNITIYVFLPWISIFPTVLLYPNSPIIGRIV